MPACINAVRSRAVLWPRANSIKSSQTKAHNNNAYMQHMQYKVHSIGLQIAICAQQKLRATLYTLADLYLLMALTSEFKSIVHLCAGCASKYNSPTMLITTLLVIVII